MSYIHNRRMGGALAGMGVLVALVVMLGLLTWAPALAIPQPGHYFYGNATIVGTPAPAGTVITASIVGTTLVYSSTVGDNNGGYGSNPPYMVVPGDDPDTPEREGGRAGDTVEFYVGVSKARLFDVATSTWWDAYPWASGSTTNLTLDASAVYGLILSPATAAQGGRPGEIVTYTLALTNSGNFTDSFDVGVSGNSWPTSGPVTVGPLGAGVSTIFQVAVTIPSTAAGDATDTATVTLTSQGDGTKSASSALTTTAHWYRVFLPLVFGNYGP